MRLADKFNRKRTIEKDHLRMQRIHCAPAEFLRMKSDSTSSSSSTVMIPIHDLKSPFVSPSSFQHAIPLVKEIIHPNVVPKIEYKEVPIPSYLESDAFNLVCSISTMIPMQLLQNKDNEDIAHLKHTKGVKRIVHIYQETYANNVHATGLGDFLRGCFFVTQFCRKHDFESRIVVAHPMADFLEQFRRSNRFASLPFVKMFTSSNLLHSVFDKNGYIEDFVLVEDREKDYIGYLNELPVVHGATVYAYNIFFPIRAISQQDKEMLRALMRPTMEMQQYVEHTLHLLGLVPLQYIIIHIRSGDIHLLQGSSKFSALYVNIIKDEIQQIIFNNKDKRVLLIADNLDIKRLMQNVFPGRICCLFKEITHLGEGVLLEREQIKNTLLDFYLMRYSHFIFSMTIYDHGSGFSHWCAALYDIPFRCKYIKPE